MPPGNINTSPAADASMKAGPGGVVRVSAESLLRTFVQNLAERLGDAMVVEVHEFRKADGSLFTGYTLRPVKPDAAEIEVWAGPGGWNITLAGLCQVELPEADGGEALGIIRSVIARGAEVRRRGLGRVFRTPLLGDERSRPAVKSWAPWVPGFTFGVGELESGLECRIFS